MKINNILSGFLAFFLFANACKADGLILFDDTFSVGNLPIGLSTTAILSGRWGTWDPATLTFSQQLTDGSSNVGYVDLGGKEITISLNQVDNSVYVAGRQLSLAMFAVGTNPNVQTQNFISATHAVILQDPTWIAPTFTAVPEFKNVLFTASTTAVMGTYSFNGGNELFGLAVIPEPSSMSLVVTGLASILAFRRKRALNKGERNHEQSNI